MQKTGKFSTSRAHPWHRLSKSRIRYLKDLFGLERTVIWVAWRNALLALCGAWFVLSAFAMNPLHSSSYGWSAFLLGGLTLIGGLWALGDAWKRPWRHWLMALFGLYLAISPWTYGMAVFIGIVVMNLLVGAAILAASIANALL